MIKKILLSCMVMFIFIFSGAGDIKAEGLQYASVQFMGSSSSGAKQYEICIAGDGFKECRCGVARGAKACADENGIIKYDLCKPCAVCSNKIYPYTVDNCISSGQLGGRFCTDDDGVLHASECKCKSEYKLCPCGESPTAKPCTYEGVIRWSICKDCTKCPFDKYPFTDQTCISPKQPSGSCVGNDGTVRYSSCECGPEYTEECPCGGAVGATSCTIDDVMKWTACKACAKDCSDFPYTKNNCLAPAELGGESCVDGNNTHWKTCLCSTSFAYNIDNCSTNALKSPTCHDSNGQHFSDCVCPDMYRFPSKASCDAPKELGGLSCTDKNGTNWTACNCPGDYNMACLSSSGLVGVGDACDGMHKSCACASQFQWDNTNCTGDNAPTGKICQIGDVKKWDQCSCDPTKFTQSCNQNGEVGNGTGCLNKYKSCKCGSNYVTCPNGPRIGASSPCMADGGSKYLSSDCVADCSGYTTCSGTGVVGVSPCSADGSKFLSCKCNSSYGNCPSGTSPRPGASACTVDGGSKYLSSDCEAATVECSGYVTCGGTGVEGVSPCSTDSSKFLSCRCSSSYITCPNGPKSGASSPCTADGGSKYLSSDCNSVNCSSYVTCGGTGVEGVNQCPTDNSKFVSCRCQSNYITCPSGPKSGASSPCIADGGNKYLASDCEAATVDCSSYKTCGGTGMEGVNQCPTDNLKFVSCRCKSSYAACPSGTVPKSGASACTADGGSKYLASDCVIDCSSYKTCNGTGMEGVNQCPTDNSKFVSCRCKSSYATCPSGTTPKSGAVACTADGGSKYLASDCVTDCSSYKTCSGTGVEGVNQCPTDNLKFASCRCNSSYAACPSGTSPKSGASACTADGGSKYLASDCVSSGAGCTPSSTIICTDLNIVYNNGDVLPYIDTNRKSEIWGIKSGGLAIKKTGSGVMRWSEAYDAAAADGGFMPSVADFQKLHAESSLFNATASKLSSNGVSAEAWPSKGHLTSNDMSGSVNMNDSINGCYNTWNGCTGSAFCALGSGTTVEQFRSTYCRYCGPDHGYKCIIREYNPMTGVEAGCNKWTFAWTLRIARSL